MRGWMTRVETAALLLCLPAAGCGRARERPRVPEGADALTGVWSTELVLTDPLLRSADPAKPRVANGTISLLRKDGVPGGAGLHGTPTHVGVHTVELVGFGFRPHPAGAVPAVAARWIAPDSVEMTFESAAGAGELMYVAGHLEGDSVVGRWHYSTRVAGAGGRVLMRRARTAP